MSRPEGVRGEESMALAVFTKLDFKNAPNLIIFDTFNYKEVLTYTWSYSLSKFGSNVPKYVILGLEVSKFSQGYSPVGERYSNPHATHTLLSVSSVVSGFSLPTNTVHRASPSTCLKNNTTIESATNLTICPL